MTVCCGGVCDDCSSKSVPQRSYGDLFMQLRPCSCRVFQNTRKILLYFWAIYFLLSCLFCGGFFLCSRYFLEGLWNSHWKSAVGVRSWILILSITSLMHGFEQAIWPGWARSCVSKYSAVSTNGKALIERTIIRKTYPGRFFRIFPAL